MTSYNFENIRTLLIWGFTDEELRRLCYDVPKFRPVYDQLARNTGKTEIVDLLIEHAEKTMQFDLLLNWANEKNSTRFEMHQPYYEDIVEKQTAQIQLILDGEIANFTSDKRDILVGVLATVLRVEPSSVRILRVQSGSIRVTIEVPEQSLIRLNSLSQTDISLLVSVGVQTIEGDTTKTLDLQPALTYAPKISQKVAQIQSSQASFTTNVPLTLDSSGMVPMDFVIVTALEEERDAVLSKLPGYRKLAPSDDDVRVYYSADLPVTFADGSRGVYRVVVMPLLGMGRVQATVATADAIRRWRPRYVLVVGIAGGVAAKEVKLGDILVSDQIVDYELQKLTSKGAQVRWEVHRADARLIGAAHNFSGADWQALLTTKRPDEGVPKHHIGPIASGDKVIALGKVLAKYRKVWPAIIGVEMEAAGVATATFQAAKPPGFFMIRGVSDLADEDKNSAGVQNWRIYACDVAASYAIALLKSGPVVLFPPMERLPLVNEQEIPGAKEISPTVSSVKPSDQKLHPVSKSKSKPSWIQDFSRPQPSLQDSQISTILRGYPLFRSHLAEQELEFLFGNVGCFWSRHPTYATVVSLYPQVVVANTGSGKTAFAHALTQIGDADGKPLENTLPILLNANMRTIKDTQAQIAGALLKFILDNLATLNDLTQPQKKFLLRFLVSAQETELVKVRLNQILEADKSLVDSIERVETPSRFNQTQWPLYARQCLELLGFERAILVVDLNNANAVQLKFWLQNMTRWAAHNLVVKLFLPENLSYPSGELSDSIELLPLTWRKNQIVEMVNWRFESLARLTGIRANLEFLFDEGLYLQFLGQAQGNPGRLAQLWRYLFEDHLNFSHTCSTFTLDNFARAVEKLK